MLVLEFSLDELPALAGDLFLRFNHLKVWVLEGMLGAGKTTLVQHLGEQFGVNEAIISPTFSLVNEYHAGDGRKWYHLDLYRLKSFRDLEEIGMQEMEESGYFCLVEWASAVGYVPSCPWLEIRLEHIEQTRRRIRIIPHES